MEKIENQNVCCNTCDINGCSNIEHADVIYKANNDNTKCVICGDEKVKEIRSEKNQSLTQQLES